VGPSEGGREVTAVVSALLEESGDSETAEEALARGAVFVDRRRAAPGMRVRPGQSVSLSLRTAPEAELDVLLEDGDLIVLAKPAGISSVPDLSDRAGSLLGLAERRFGAGLHLLGRLDRDVTGIVVALRTERARTRAVELRRRGEIERVYGALVCPAPLAAEEELDGAIGRHPTDPRRRSVGGRDAVPSLTRVRVLDRLAAGTVWLEARPVTGRTHQIRVHLSHAGHPIVGDRAYGGVRRLTLPDGRVLPCSRVMLHARRLDMPHPGGKGRLRIEAPWPADLSTLLRALGARS
jgi:23S rRNA pseudouridine1911/1915/1917 synthase